MRARVLLGAATAVLVVAALGCFAVAWRSAAGQRYLIPFRPAPIAVQPALTQSSGPTSNVTAPVRLVVPAVGLSARVVAVGLNQAGQIVIPGPSLAGWYEQGPAPGAPGPAVIVGHVDTYKGPAVFYRLTGVHPGDDVQVGHADDSWSTFVITKVTVIMKTAFPSKAVFGPTSKAAIRLITCTGPFDTTTRSYVDSLIAWGELVPPPR